MNNMEIRNVLDRIRRVQWLYRLDYDFQEVLTNLKELNALAVIEEATKILKDKKVSIDKIEELKKRIKDLDELKSWVVKCFKTADESEKAQEYKYDTTEDCLKLLRSFEIQKMEENHFGLELYYYEAAWEIERNQMIQGVLGWNKEGDCSDENFLSEEQNYKWQQIESDLPNVLSKIIKEGK